MMKIKRVMAVLLVCVLISADVMAIAEEALSILQLPSALKVIEEEAFYGDTSLEKVIVPEGAEKIEGKAFADSSIVEIELPGSLEDISDNAFEGVEDLKVSAPEDSYAYGWAVDKGYIEDDTILDPLAPVIKTAVQENGTVIHLEWENTENAEYHYVYWSANNFENDDFVVRYVEDTQYTIYGLLPNTEYSLCVESYIQDELHFSGFFSVATGNVINHIPITGLSVRGETGNDVFFGEGTVGETDKNTRNWVAAEPVTATNQQYKWTSSNPDVASIDENTGVITCLSTGVSIITVATTDGSNISISGSYFVNAGISATDTFKYYVENEECIIVEYIGLDTEVTVPAEIEGFPVTTIGENAFYENKDIVCVVLPENITTIEGSGFAKCPNLESVDLPDSLTTISYFAFEGCESLKIITLPKNLESLDNGVFRGCDGLTDIYVDAENDTFSSMDGILVCDGYEIVCYPAGKNEINYTIPVDQGIHSIDYYAFAGNDYLASVNIPDNVNISGCAFTDCSNLKEVYIGYGIDILEFDTFANCVALELIRIPSTVTYIEDECFKGCSGFTAIVVENSYAHEWCVNNGIEVEITEEEVNNALFE